MPHVIVKVWKGKSENQKTLLADAITKNICEILNYEAPSVSVAIEEFEPGNWADQVYKPDIVNASGKLYKQPGYEIFE